MTDRKKDEPIIELTDVVEEGPAPAAEGKRETAPSPGAEKKMAEPPKLPKKEGPGVPWDFKGIPDSPLRKFILADEEPTPPEIPPVTEKSLGFSPLGPKPPQPPSEPPRRPPEPPRVTADPGRVTPGLPRISPEPPRPAPEPPRKVAEPFRQIPDPPRQASEPFRQVPEPPRQTPEPPRRAPEPPRPSLPSIDAEMRALRETILSRVEKWVAQDGVGVLERVAREIFPKLAEDMIRKEIEKLRAEAEEKE